MSRLMKIIFNNNTFDLSGSSQFAAPVVQQDVNTFVATRQGIVNITASESLKDSLFYNGTNIVFIDLNNITVPVNTGDSITSDIVFNVVAFYEK